MEDIFMLLFDCFALDERVPFFNSFGRKKKKKKKNILQEVAKLGESTPEDPNVRVICLEGIYIIYSASLWDYRIVHRVFSAVFHVYDS